MRGRPVQRWPNSPTTQARVMANGQDRSVAIERILCMLTPLDWRWHRPAASRLARQYRGAAMMHFLRRPRCADSTGAEAAHGVRNRTVPRPWRPCTRCSRGRIRHADGALPVAEQIRRVNQYRSVRHGGAMPPWILCCVFLFTEQAHALFQAIDRERKHAITHQLPHYPYRLAVLPQAFLLGIEPDEFREGCRETRQPDRARFLVVVLDRATMLQDFIGAHGGVADKNQLGVGRVFAQYVPGGKPLGLTAPVVLPQAVVDAVMEVKKFHVLEFRLRRREQLLGTLDMVIHAAAHVEQHQHLDAVLALGAHSDVEITRIIGRGGDGGVQRQFVFRPLARELAQAAQRHFQVARAQFAFAVIILVAARFPYLDGGAVATLAAYAYAFGIGAAIAEWRSAAGAYPLAAAFVAFFLLLQQFVQTVHQFIVAEFFQLRFLLVREFALHAFEQPVQRDRRIRFKGCIDALEILREGAVELVEMGFILDQGQARQIITIVHRGADDVLLQRLQ